MSRKEFDTKAKKKLSQILASYYQNGFSYEEIREKEVFKKTAEEMHKAKKSFYTVMELHQKLVEVFEELKSKQK